MLEHETSLADGAGLCLQGTAGAGRPMGHGGPDDAAGARKRDETPRRCYSMIIG